MDLAKFKDLLRKEYDHYDRIDLKCEVAISNLNTDFPTAGSFIIRYIIWFCLTVLLHKRLIFE